MAIVVLSPPATIAIGDTVDVNVRALNRNGDTLTTATFELTSLTPDTLGVDNTRLAVIGKSAGPGRWIARVGTLPSAPLLITVN